MSCIAMSFLLGYLIGGINPAYLIAKLRGFDIRQHGSKNAGASNALITMGKKVGVFSALFDILKAVGAVLLAGYLFSDCSLAQPVAGAACIFGHIFPLFMRFRGGKGLACLGGVILAFDYRLFLVLLLAELFLALLVDYICVVPITASILFPLLYWVMSSDYVGALVYAAISLVILFKHWENIKRIRMGTEAHLSFLWKKDKEIERLQDRVQDSLFEENEDEK